VCKSNGAAIGEVSIPIPPEIPGVRNYALNVPAKTGGPNIAKSEPTNAPKPANDKSESPAKPRAEAGKEITKAPAAEVIKPATSAQPVAKPTPTANKFPTIPVAIGVVLLIIAILYRIIF
jgi:hypothetical protein